MWGKLCLRPHWCYSYSRANTYYHSRNIPRATTPVIRTEEQWSKTTPRPLIQETNADILRCWYYYSSLGFSFSGFLVLVSQIFLSTRNCSIIYHWVISFLFYGYSYMRLNMITIPKNVFGAYILGIHSDFHPFWRHSLPLVRIYFHIFIHKLHILHITALPGLRNTFLQPI